MLESRFNPGRGELLSARNRPNVARQQEHSAMLSKVLPIGMAAAFLVAAVALVNAQQPPAAQPGGVVAAQQPAAVATTTFRAKQVLGSKILINNNTSVGTVDDIVFDNAGNLEYLI